MEKQSIKINKTYCMDNLELLKQLPNECINLICCDILYNTGKKLKDYNDNLGTPQQAMEWYKPRLIEMKRVLNEDGIVLLQCDYRLVHYLKIEMDNIFGINNFVNEIIWTYKSPSSFSMKHLSNKHDNLLVYSKSLNYNINIDDIREEYTESSIKQAKRGNIAFGKKAKINPKGKFPTDVWNISTLNSMAKERVGYDTQKPKKLLEKIIRAFSNKNDIVADFFCGSGTTLVVAKELKRNYIGCDINPRAIEITNERLKNVHIDENNS